MDGTREQVQNERPPRKTRSCGKCPFKDTQHLIPSLCCPFHTTLKSPTSVCDSSSPLYLVDGCPLLSFRESRMDVFVAWSFGERNRTLWIHRQLLSMSHPLQAHVWSMCHAPVTTKYRARLSVPHVRGLRAGLAHPSVCRLLP